MCTIYNYSSRFAALNDHLSIDYTTVTNNKAVAFSTVLTGLGSFYFVGRLVVCPVYVGDIDGFAYAMLAEYDWVRRGGNLRFLVNLVIADVGSAHDDYLSSVSDTAHLTNTECLDNLAGISLTTLIDLAPHPDPVIRLFVASLGVANEQLQLDTDNSVSNRAFLWSQYTRDIARFGSLRVYCDPQIEDDYYNLKGSLHLLVYQSRAGRA